MSLAERADDIRQRRQLNRQIRWIERLEKQVEESGMVTETQLDFSEAQGNLAEEVDPNVQENWNERADQAFLDPSGEKLTEMLEQLSLSELTLLIKSWKQDLQQRRDDLG